MTVEYIDISHKYLEYKDQIIEFLQSLKEEKLYFKLDLDRWKEFLVTVVAIDNGKIVAVAASEKRKAGMFRAVAMIKSAYQGNKISRPLVEEWTRHAKKYHHIVLLVMENKNIRVQRFIKSMGWKIIGQRGKLVYGTLPFNYKGKIIEFLLIIAFPFIKYFDQFRS